MRGRKPVETIRQAKKFAEKQGYRWVDNPDRDMPFDAMLYRDHDAFALRVRTAGKSPGEYDLWEEFFREDFEILRTLPMPPGIGRELWVRYTWTRKFHRYRLVDQHFSELTMIDRELPRFNPEKTPGNNHNPGKAER